MFEEIKPKLKPYLTRMAAVQGVETPLVRWGIVVMILVLFWSVMLMPYLEWRDQRIELLQSKLSKVERLLGLQHANDEWNEAEAIHEQVGETLMPMFFQGSSYTAVQTDLLNVLRKQYAQLNLILESQRLMESETQDGVGERIGVQLNLRGNLHEILAFVDGITASGKLLVINGLFISPFSKEKARLQIEVIGFRQQQRVAG